MIATSVLLILSVLPMLSQAAPKPKQDQSINIQGLLTNAKLLHPMVKEGMTNYAKTCLCTRYSISFHLTQTISEKTVKNAIEDTQSSLYPFVKLLFDIFEEEKDLHLKDNLKNIGNKLNETYDSAVIMMGQKLTKNPKSLASLNRDIRLYMKTRSGSKIPLTEVRNYVLLNELYTQIFDILYAFGKIDARNKNASTKTVPKN